MTCGQWEVRGARVRRRAPAPSLTTDNRILSEPRRAGRQAGQPRAPRAGGARSNVAQSRKDALGTNVSAKKFHQVAAVFQAFGLADQILERVLH